VRHPDDALVNLGAIRKRRAVGEHDARQDGLAFVLVPAAAFEGRESTATDHDALSNLAAEPGLNAPVSPGYLGAPAQRSDQSAINWRALRLRLHDGVVAGSRLVISSCRPLGSAK